MMKKILILCFFQFFFANAYALNAEVDHRGVCYPAGTLESESEYYISFNATAASLENASPGHAYITIFSPNDTINGLCEAEQGFGQSPSNVKPVLGFSVYDDGGVREEKINDLIPVHKLTVRVNYETYSKVKSLIVDWKGKKYILSKQDCLNFIMDIANVIPWFNVPERKYNQLPTDYLLKVIRVNS